MTHIGRTIAIRIAGVVIATSGLALLGVGTAASPLSTGHNKLVSVIQDPEDCRGTTSHGDAPAANPGEGDSDCCRTELTLHAGAPVTASETGVDSEGNDRSSCSTSTPTSASTGTSALSSSKSTATAGVQAATTPVVPKTGADIEVGLGLGLLVAGGGMALVATRRGRSKS